MNILRAIYRFYLIRRYRLNKAFMLRNTRCFPFRYSWCWIIYDGDYIGFELLGFRKHPFDLASLAIYFDKSYKTVDYTMMARAISWQNFKRGKVVRYKLNTSNTGGLYQ